MAYHVTGARTGSVGGGRRLAFFALLAIAGGLGVAAMIAAVWPSDGPGLPERWIDAGSLEDFSPGTITTLQIESADPTGPPTAHVVRLEDGELLVISGRDPMGCAIPWRPQFTFDGQQGWFRDPCRGSTYDAEGRIVFGPSMRDLDRLEFEVTGRGVLRIEVAHPVEPPMGGWPR